MSGLGGSRIVVTGGLGLIGSHVVRAVAGQAAEVIVVDALVPEHGGRLEHVEAAANVRIVQHDLRDPRGLRELVDGADVVFNLAGQRSHTDSMRDPLSDLEHNCRAQLTLLEACRRTLTKPVVVFASTRQVYGRVDGARADESYPVVPVDVNGVHNAAAEQYHRIYDRVHGVPAVVLRLTNTYGPGMRIRDARQGFLGTWLEAALRGNTFEVWGGYQKRDLVYVDDVADAFVRAAAEPDALGNTFNVGGETASLLDIAELVARLAGGGSFIVRELPADAAAIDIGDFTADDSAFRSLTGWAPAVGLEDGLRRTVEHYRRSGSAYWDAA